MPNLCWSKCHNDKTATKSKKPNKLKLLWSQQQTWRCKCKEDSTEGLQSAELENSSVKLAEAQKCTEHGGTQGGKMEVGEIGETKFLFFFFMYK